VLLKFNALGIDLQIFGVLALVYAMVLLFLLVTLILLLKGEESGDVGNSHWLSNTTAIRWAQVSEYHAVT
jgi:hypothetical protein